MSQHQSQSNLNLLCDIDSNFVVAKVSGHSNSNNSRGKHSITKTQDKSYCDGNNKSNMILNHPHNHPTSNHINNNVNFNFARVSIKQIKSKIQLNNSTYSLTLLESSAIPANVVCSISSMLTGNNIETTIANENSNLVFSNNNNNDDVSTVTNTIDNCDSINNKHLIKCKSITDLSEQSNNPIVIGVEANDNNDDENNYNDERNSNAWNAKHNKINLINNQSTSNSSNSNNNNLNICEASTVAVDDDKDDESGTNANNEFVQQKLNTTSGCLRNKPIDNNDNINDNDDMLFRSNFHENNLNNCVETSTGTATPTIIPPTMPLVSSEKPQRAANLTVSSSCSSTSNENNNAIVVKNGRGELVGGDDDMELTDEEKLLNVNQKRNTNPFLINNIQLERNNQHDVKLTSSESTMNEEIIENKTATCSLECNETMHVHSNEISKHIQLQSTSIPIEMVAVDSSTMLTTKTRLKARGSIVVHEKHPITSNSCIEDYQDNSFLDYDEEDSDEFCKSEIFDVPNSGKVLLETKAAVNIDDIKYNRQIYDATTTTATTATTKSRKFNNRFKINQNDQPTSIMNDNDNSFIIKSAIPTCSFQRQDYRQPGEIPDNDDNTGNNNKKFFTSNKKPKSGDLFHMPSFSKTGKTPTLKHANLNYPNKTCHGDVIGCPNDRKYFEKIHSKAKYQLIKLGQKCKILTHHQPTTVSTIPGGGSMGNVKTTIIKTNTNHRKKYQYYNEINKSYQLDDFIRSTHLLNGDNNEDMTQQQHQHHNDDLNNRNSVVYKTYKSEIDLTRNLTYLNAFLNDNFDREPTTTVAVATPTKKQSKSKNHHNHHHKRAKSCSKNINYITTTTASNANDQLTMINGTADESIDGEITPRPSIAYCNDDNVTSSSFEYQASMKRPKREIHEQISGEKSGRSNTTSSSLSSSDYASVYSGPTNGTKDNNGRSHHGQVSDRAGAVGAGGKLISTPEESLEFYDRSFVDRSPRQKRKPKIRSRRSSQPIPEHTNALPYEDIDDQIMLFDESNFVELKNNMKKFHPDLYNSVPQFEDLNAIDFYENPNYHHYNGEADNEAYHTYGGSGNGQLSSSYNDQSNIQHQDYLEHFNVQQQLLDHGDVAGTSAEQLSNGFLMTNGYGYGSSNNRQNSTSLIHPKHGNTPRDFYYNSQSTGNTQNDVYGSRKLFQNTQNPAITPTASTSATYGHPHRVIVSKSKKQKGELVLEYEC